MQLENQNFSWISSLYWTLATITTVGYGDIVFKSDLGKVFSIVVMVSGIFFILVVIPFTILRLFQSSARAPREVLSSTKDHVILTNYDSITRALIKLFINFKITYVVIIEDLNKALELIDNGIKVVWGAVDDPETYKLLNIEKAALVALSGLDTVNTSITYTVRSVSAAVPIMATASNKVSKDVLEIAGCNHVLTLNEKLGNSFARRVIGGDAMAHIIGEIDNIIIAEATATGTPVVGKTLKEIQFPLLCGITVIGIWFNGRFEMAQPNSIIHSQSMLVIAGSKENIERYNEIFCIYNSTTQPVLIIGGGKVGTIMAEVLSRRKIAYKFLEKDLMINKHNKNMLRGNAMDMEILIKSGIQKAPAVAITTHNDDDNLYIATLCRHLNNSVQIICRATKENSVHLLNKAGCEFVMSYASAGANNIFNFLKSGNILMISEGVDVFKIAVPKQIVGKKISEIKIREESGCSIIGLKENDKVKINPPPDLILSENSELVLIGTAESESRFLEKYT